MEAGFAALREILAVVISRSPGLPARLILRTVSTADTLQLLGDRTTIA